MRLAAISTATWANTETSKADRIGKANPYWTVAYGDVCAAIDREMSWRQQAEGLKERCERLEQILTLMKASPVAREVAAQLGEQLVVVTEATPWWRHLHGLLQLEIDQAVNDALMPDLTNDTANLRRGRAAMLKDFRGLLQSLWLQAQTRKRESA